MEKTLSRVQYLVGEDGQRTGVVLDWESYQALHLASPPPDPEMLGGLSVAELQALAAGELAASHQERLEAVLERNREGTLTADEARELDSLVERIDSLNTIKARALYTLQHLGVTA